jgi:hypothetical protein
MSIVAMALRNDEKSEESWQNKVSSKLKSIAVIFGQGKVIYSVVFISIMYLYKTELLVSFSDTYFYILLLLWGLLLLIDTKRIHSNFSLQKEEKNKDALGEIFSVQSNNMFLVKLFEDKTNINKFDIVRFRYRMDKTKNNISNGFIFDTYNLNAQKWAKILTIYSTHQENISKFNRNTVYKISNLSEKNQMTELLNVDNFVGVVIEGSKIGVIKFEYSKKVNNLQEGDLLELTIENTRIFYQVFGGITDFEKLENKNESGFIEGEAIQLGTWNCSTMSFEKYGWLPQINTPIFLANTTNIETPTFEYPEFELGTIPNTTLPSIIDLHTAASHHLALLGVTGAGKSFLTRILIKELQKDTKIICVDFTGEWKIEFDDEETEDFTTIDEVIENDKISLIELSSVSNTTESLNETNSLLQEIFTFAKQNVGHKKICLILEEAHTIVPETTFLGDYGDYSANKALVNKMSQIALQGRKYGVGLFVIAQRTANVSKTVLTQCNTIISFQAFDETSFNFLGNYIGKDLVQALPNLKKYHAIVTGKAIKSNIPMIVNLERSTDE